MENTIREALRNSAQNLHKMAASENIVQMLTSVTEVIVDSYKRGGGLFVAGNGGSAADAQHLVAELVVKLSQDRTPIKAFAFTVDTSILTAIGNDFGYEYIFERQVRGLMNKSDIFLGITTSGNSANILLALEACKKKGIKSILLSGKDGGKAKDLADYALIVPGENTANIQEAHVVIYHTLCFLLEQKLVAEGICSYIK